MSRRAENKIFPWRWRKLAPAGGFPSANSIITGCLKLKQTAPSLSPLEVWLAANSGSSLPSHAVFPAASGKQALAEILTLIRKISSVSKVCLAGYTCPDIVAACVKTGYSVRPIDINEKTLELESFPAEEEVLILSNLYGLADRIPDAAEVASKLIIDDACQSALSCWNEKRVGFRTAFGVFSFGRGKAICGIGGGTYAVSTDWQGLLPKKAPGEERTPLSNELFDLIKGVASSVLERPYFYSMPSVLPFLHLGETIYNPAYRDRPLSNVQKDVAALQIARIDETRETLLTNARAWSEALEGLPLIEPFLERGFSFTGEIVPTRYPVIFPSGASRDSALSQLAQEGLGASKSYPMCIADLCTSDKRVLPSQTPKAREIASRIITLPLHCYVQRTDIERASAIIQRSLSERC